MFADYQLLAAMGGLIEYVKSPPPADAAPLDPVPFAIFPTKLPPILLRAPMTGPEPLEVTKAQPFASYASGDQKITPFDGQPDVKFSDRWQGLNPVSELIDAAANWKQQPQR